MPPTLTTKSSPDINAPRFTIVTKALAGEEVEGKPRFRAIASSTIVDRDGDEISLKALQQMAAKFRDGVTIFTDHENKVANAYGTTDSAEIVQAGNDPKTGTAIWDLAISGPVNEPSPNAMQLHRSISGGYVKLGCSIDAFVLEHTRKKSGGLNVDGLDVFAASIVGVPANQRSWTQKAVRAIKSFHPDEEDDVVPPDVNEGLELHEGDVGELVVHPDGTSDATLVAKAGTPEAEAWLDANSETVELTDAAATDEVVDEAVEKAADNDGDETCPACGKGRSAGDCSNNFHTAEKSVDESASDVQESAQETPETASTDTTEADTPIEEKTASVPTEDVHALMGHIERLVKEIGYLRAENAALTDKNTALEASNKAVYGEVELAKQVIGKVMEIPLRSKTAAYVSDFTDVHKLFDPDIAAYLSKRAQGG